MRMLLLCGPAFSGKTSLAEALALRGFVHVSLDRILAERGLQPGEGLPAAAWEMASAEACVQLAAVVRARRDAVLDDTLCYRFLRDRYRTVAAEVGAAVVLVVLAIDDDEVLRRARENERVRRRPGLRPQVLAAHLASFEWPTPDEAPIVLAATASLPDQLAALPLLAPELTSGPAW